MRTRLASTSRVLALGVAEVLAGCGSDVDPGLGSAPGTGTGTLEVIGSAYAAPTQPQPAMTGDFCVKFSVRVSRGGQAVTVGEVTVTSPTGKVALTYSGEAGWFGLAIGYHEVYALDIVAGSDRLTGARVDGPDIHAISQPAEGSAIDTSAPLVVTWRTSETAEVAALRAEPADWIEVPDSGMYSLPPGTFPSDRRQARVHAVRVARTNQIALTGATGGSSWSVTIENAVHVVSPPLPL